MIAIVDYGMGNLRSVERALRELRADGRLVRDHDELRQAERLILPGVGAFGIAMQRLRELGLVDVLNELVIEERRPLLGICLGMQLLCNESHEHGHHEGLGWIPATVRRIDPGDARLRVPHVGWNDVRATGDSVLFDGGPAEGVFYFVHSYYVDCDNDSIVSARCRYGVDLTATIEHGNIAATQFHPEKSQVDGLALLDRFIQWQPALAPTR